MPIDAPDWTTWTQNVLVVGEDSVPSIPSTEIPIVKEGRYSGADQIYQTLVSWTVAADRVGTLKEISWVMDSPDFAQFQLTIAGTVIFTDWSPQATVDLPLPDVKLLAGVVVLLEVRSTDGTSIEVDGLITGKESF